MTDPPVCLRQRIRDIYSRHDLLLQHTVKALQLVGHPVVVIMIRADKIQLRQQESGYQKHDGNERILIHSDCKKHDRKPPSVEKPSKRRDLFPDVKSRAVRRQKIRNSLVIKHSLGSFLQPVIDSLIDLYRRIRRT